MRPSGWMLVLLVGVLTAGSLYLRTRQLDFYYWIDEAISVGIASHPLSQLPALLRQDGSPPLYYVLLHFWMKAFGTGEVATHWLSVLFGLTAVPVAYWGGASLFGRRAGVFSAVLAAGVPFLTEYAQETRMYALLLVLSMVVAVAFVHAFVLRRRRYLPLFSVAMAAALYTHNWALFLGVAAAIAYLFCLWQTPVSERRPLLRDGAIGFGLAALLYLPWLPTLVYQARHTGAPWALPPVIWSLTQGLYGVVGGRGAAMALLLAAGSGLVALRALRGPDARPARVAAIALAILGVGTLLIAWAYAKTTPAWSYRYLAVVVGPLIVLFGWGLARARGLGIVALVLVCCFWVLDPISTSRVAKSNVALMARAVRPQTGADTLVLSTQPEQVPALAYYLPNVRRFANPWGIVPDPRVMDWRNALAQFEHSSVTRVLAPMIASLPAGDRVLLAIPGSFQKTPKWMSLIHHTTVTWERYLRHDRRLVLMEDTSPQQFKTGLPVRGLLFRVR